uniref:Aldehyde dehydrogenase n=2 Tax=Corethron hystrix TaxID=216773 RepID=A0A7S1BIS4_9STRA|mmetsp:Transcript_27045/g.62190  ORF Transcript_27045/g.62190 Transcript_27045/m.62190 type:complete len:522 (+) Transcript_27045:132-1697(+)|eukprot:CAMPEP_0113310908 /NCGR_PEP_ID=MMETSP0010_2-20120614/8367_1 /TAXON_ID=216773 ORGANISM="Corethron hystrix, Strain 308" /NCGR_SAMPLE_ID=MMETSP0010_2 /ASSEMBLY_ACC=CAM_ASM_000155 /LENGTH=521 /DNA_ID=CAMNT_0000166461 /DNA_START=63 /DNA_END=1628 /DNA_ORIENTATION=- /assembly_acc=CAM_ASM_000155
MKGSSDEDAVSSRGYRDIYDELNATFESQLTKDLAWREKVLLRTLDMFRENHDAWTSAVIADLGGGRVRAVMEIGTVCDEVRTCISHLRRWAADRPASLGDPISELPLLDRRVVRPAPKGVVLVLGTWNFPINLAFVPLIDGLAAGNCCVVKPSEMTPRVAALTATLVHRYLPQEAVRVVNGAVPTATALLRLPFKHITYTGSTAVGRIVMAAAARGPTPCTLELGGKNPTFVDASADLRLAADRIVVAKTTNAGQWCVTADYVLCDAAVVDEFGKRLVEAARRMLGDAATQKGDGADTARQWYNRIVNEQHARRVLSLLEEDHGGEVLLGGAEEADVKERFVPFTIVKDPRRTSRLLTEEIFGPILVLCAVENADEAIRRMKEIDDSPLAMHVYSNNKKYTDKILERCISGSVGVNTTAEQMMADTVPFGGVGTSGFGAYHGKRGFDEYSHLRSIMYRTQVVPMMLLPKFMWPVANAFPAWVEDVMVKYKITGMVPEWAKNAFWLGGAGLVAFCVARWKN